MIKSILEKISKTKKSIKVHVKGSFGELKQGVRLYTLPRENYKILNDIIIPHREKTTQIDHLVISKYGVFVIENKNFAGSIYGSEYDKNWTQVMGRTNYKFYNPVLQNYAHIKAIENIIGEDKKIYSIIVFSDKSTLKKVEVNNDDIKVINEVDLLNVIKSFTYQHLNDCEVKDCLKKISSTVDTTSQNKRNHVKNVKEIIDQNNKVCPRCKSELVKRNSQYGEFLGCSSYPKCKYTKREKDNTTS